jgi:hypothetical protein
MVCRSEVCNREEDITISVRNSLLVNRNYISCTSACLTAVMSDLSCWCNVHMMTYDIDTASVRKPSLESGFTGVTDIWIVNRTNETKASAFFKEHGRENCEFSKYG